MKNNNLIKTHLFAHPSCIPISLEEANKCRGGEITKADIALTSLGQLFAGVLTTSFGVFIACLITDFRLIDICKKKQAEYLGYRTLRLYDHEVPVALLPNEEALAQTYIHWNNNKYEVNRELTEKIDFIWDAVKENKKLMYISLWLSIPLNTWFWCRAYKNRAAMREAQLLSLNEKP